jgi:hypothetical protein
LQSHEQALTPGAKRIAEAWKDACSGYPPCSDKASCTLHSHNYWSTHGMALPVGAASASGYLAFRCICVDVYQDIYDCPNEECQCCKPVSIPTAIVSPGPNTMPIDVNEPPTYALAADSCTSACRSRAP